MTKLDQFKELGPPSGYALPTTVGLANHDPTRQRAPGYSIGVRLQEKPTPTPGPKYLVESGLTPRGFKHGPSYSLTSRPTKSIWVNGLCENPGPCAYNVPSFSVDRRGPVYSFGTICTTTKKSTGPAPNSYQLPSTLGAHVPYMRGSPAISIHKRGPANTSFAYDSAKTPGPARYGPVDLSYTIKRAPAVSIAGRTLIPSMAVDTPGPGAYDVSRCSDNVSKNSPRFIIGVRHGANASTRSKMADVSD